MIYACVDAKGMPRENIVAANDHLHSPLSIPLPPTTQVRKIRKGSSQYISLKHFKDDPFSIISLSLEEFIRL